MGYMLAKQQSKDYVSIGEDSGMVGGQNYWRSFSVREYNGVLLLTETKTTKHCANFTRVFQVRTGGRIPEIFEYSENGENYSTNWIH